MKDVWEWLKYNLKVHPVAGWVCVVIAVVGGTSVIGHNFIGFLRDLGVLKPKTDHAIEMRFDGW